MDKIKDPATKVIREISTGYRVSDYMPGATVIPSHDGDHGKQMGGKVPIQLVVDDIPAGILEEADGRFPKLDKPADTTKNENIIPAKRRGRPPKVISSDTVSEKEHMQTVLPLQPPTPRESVAAEPKASQQITPEPSIEPQYEVTFAHQNMGTMYTRYHKVVIQNGFLVLVFNRKFKYATRYIPPYDSGKTALSITVTDSKGKMDNYTAAYSSVNFCVDDYEFSVYLLVNNTGGDDE